MLVMDWIIYNFCYGYTLVCTGALACVVIELVYGMIKLCFKEE